MSATSKSSSAARWRKGGHMIRKAFRYIAAVGVLVAAAGTLRADANTWTGGRPVETADGAPAIVAADPGSPDVVYGAFGPALYRSSDGGRTWRHLRSFHEVRALLVHPASPSTIYVAAEEVFKSTDAGETWSAMSVGGYVTSLAGSPTDVSTVYAGALDWIHKTTNAGATWSSVRYAGVIASLVIDSRDPTVSYAAAEGYAYWGDYPGSLGKTANGGVSWEKASPEAVDSVIAVAVDSGASSTVYIATGDYMWGEGSRRRSGRSALGRLRGDVDVGRPRPALRRRSKPGSRSACLGSALRRNGGRRLPQPRRRPELDSFQPTAGRSTDHIAGDRRRGTRPSCGNVERGVRPRIGPRPHGRRRGTGWRKPRARMG